MAQQPAHPGMEGVQANHPPPRVSTYREAFANTAADLMDGRPAEYLFGYRFIDEGAGGVPTPATLRTQAVQHCDRRSMAFLCLVCTPDLRQTEVRILHRFIHYLEMPGEANTGFHDKVLALLGDVQPHQYPTVEVLNTAFHLIGQAAVRVPTLEAMPAVLPGWADDGTALGPYTEQDLETELVRPQHVQLLPNRYAALLVHRTGVGPKQAYEELAGAIAADNSTEACSDVLTWLRAACTARSGGGAQSLVSGVLHSFTPVHLLASIGLRLRGNKDSSGFTGWGTGRRHRSTGHRTCRPDCSGHASCEQHASQQWRRTHRAQGTKHCRSVQGNVSGTASFRKRQQC